MPGDIIILLLDWGNFPDVMLAPNGERIMIGETHDVKEG